MAGHGEKLERKQEQAIAALLTEPTVEEAARKARVSYSSLKGWMQLPEFASAYRAARAGVLERVVARLVRACDGAVARLEENLDAANPHASNRAAIAIIASTLKGVEALDLRAEVDDLKRQIEILRKVDSDADRETRHCPSENGAAAPGAPATADAEPGAAGAGP